MAAEDMESKKSEEVPMEGSHAQDTKGKDLSIEDELKRLESLELDVSLTGEMYPQLLSLYVASFDFRNAQLFWKRSHANKKENGSEFRDVWTIAQRLWQKDYPGAYKILKEKQWSDTMKPYAETLHSSIRERAVELVQRAYNSVKASSFAALMDYDEAEALNFAKEKQWDFDSSLKVFVPKRIPNVPNEAPPAQKNHMENIRTYVSFLEN